MTDLIDKDDKGQVKGDNRIAQRAITVYAGIVTLILFYFLFSINIKDQPTPLDTTDINEIQESYSMLAGICVTVGECGNNQVVIGLEKNRTSELFYHLLLWKKKLGED